MSQQPTKAALAAAVLLVSIAPSAGAQVGTLTTVDGTVTDLAVDSSGDLLYCTEESDVGRVTTGGVVTVLADAASGPFTKALRGVVENPAGELAVIDLTGDIFELTGGVAPATKVYSDLYIIHQATDLICDANGNYVTVSRTPTSGVRGIDWVSPNGARWAYYLVKHRPIAIAVDPVNGDLLIADAANGGALRSVDTVDESHPTAPLDVTTKPGFIEANNDGDLAVEVDGSVWTIAGGDVYRYDRGTGTTTPMASGLGQLRGIAIAASSGGVPSASGWSAYLAEGANPTTIREIGNVGAPASTTAPELGTVPNRGDQILFFGTQRVYELATDLDGNLLVGGDLWGAAFKVQRVTLPGGNISTIAAQSDGLSGRIEGISTAPDGTIYAMTSAGRIHAIVESPLQVSTVFSDPLNEIKAGKDMIRDRDGTFYVADRQNWGNGQVDHVDAGGTVTPVAITDETRGVMPDPFSGDVYAVEWNDIGFHGTVGRMDTDTGAITLLPKFQGMNYTNDSTWGDGDIALDVEGNIYTASEDDFSVYRYNVETQKKVRIGSGYTNHPSGVAIARSTSPSDKQSGWSLYVTEFDFLWEIPDVPAPASVLLDRAAPPTGRLVGWLPGDAGEARAVLSDPIGGRFLVPTSAGELYMIQLYTGVVTKIAGPAQGLSGDLVAIASTSTGTIYVANRSGTVFQVDPPSGFTVSTHYDNGGGELSDVRGLVVDGQDRLYVLDRPAGVPAGKLYRLTGARTLELQAFTNRGLRMAIDPLTADLFVTQQGHPGDGGGEVLRVDTFASPPTAGHWRGAEFTLFDLGELDGDIAFDAAGNFYVTAGDDGRVERIDRATGVRTTVGGNYTRPRAAVLAPGRQATSGPMGTSLFVLDDVALYEIGVDGLPPGLPPASQPMLAPPADFRVEGFVAPDTTTPVVLESPSTPLKAYAILPSITGKVPGFPLALLGDLSDTRLIPSNYSFLWNLIAGPAPFPGFFNVLDGAGTSAPGTGFYLPDDPTLMGLNVFVDVAWIVYDFQAPNAVGTVGGTAQLYVGE